MAIIHMLGLVKDEWCFNTLEFLKNKIWILLNNHLEVVVGMYYEHVFKLDTFLMRSALKNGLVAWNDTTMLSFMREE
jgi:hypothetical protein